MASGHSQTMDSDYLTVARQSGTPRRTKPSHQPFLKIGRPSVTIGSSESKTRSTHRAQTRQYFRWLCPLCPAVVSSGEPGSYPEWTARSPLAVG